MSECVRACVRACVRVVNARACVRGCGCVCVFLWVEVNFSH